MSFRCIIIQDAQSYSENSGTGGTLWRNPNELSQNTEVIICQHTSWYCFCPVIIGRFPIFPAEAFIFITVWRLGSVIPTAVRWRSTEKQTFHAGDVTSFPQCSTYHLQCTRHEKPLVLSFPGSEGIVPQSPPASWKITTCPRTVSQHSVIFSAKRLFPHQLSGISYHPRAGRAESLLSDQCQKPVMLPFILNCTGSKVSAVSIPTRPNRTLLKYWPYRNVKKKARSPKTLWLISPALEYIEKNYMQQFSIEYLADLCHWSPTHFRRVFHDIMGTSPLDYVNNTRILKSCILLRSTEHSILDISEMVGFHSVSSFNRYFIKLMQMSPQGIPQADAAEREKG